MIRFSFLHSILVLLLVVIFSPESTGQTITTLQNGAVLTITKDVPIYEGYRDATTYNDQLQKAVSFVFYPDVARGDSIKVGEKFTVVGEVTLYPNFINGKTGRTLFTAVIPVRHATVSTIEATAQSLEDIAYLFNIQYAVLGR